MKRVKLIREEKGAVLPIVAVFIMVVAFGLAALVIDAGILFFQRRNMVAAADAGALAGARELYTGMSTDEIKQIAIDVAVTNGADVGRVTVTVNKSATAMYPYPHVIVESVNNSDLIFANVFGVGNSDVYAKAVARADKALNPGLIPLFMLDTDYEALATGGVDIVHEKTVTITDKDDGSTTTLNWSSGLMYFNDNISGIPGVTEYLGNRGIAMPQSLIDYLNNFKHIPGKTGLGQINNDPDVKNVFYQWFDNAYKHSTNPGERKAYMTGFIPVMDTQRYLDSYAGNSNTKQIFPIAYFAEVVVIDYVDHQKGDGESNAFIYTGANAYVNKVSTPYNWKSLYGPKEDTKKTIVLMKTGKTLTIDQMLAGDWTGTIYENQSIRKATLVD
ncbi:hypothetical protein KCG48_02820 [Proteiniclasticum sp. BAD-10]|uniref:Putative Flp pilus-assembly TadG-like N-terminal domain-containing protein n=1 Tax=Proteiniclasticum sediminis TaxID=2804028 RepID=A0A941CM91_9CLOT|nr:pilus assembly protein TadG-related protein [Proteiniclasticum sediminis]MBR0575266.1 hypothetical protein [Proteiniclasticum sediminis]